VAILISGHNLKKIYAGRTLFDKLAFGIETEDRIGLIGANGAGKSTLLKMMAGVVDADAGSLSKKQGIRIAYLEQSPVFETQSTLMETILQGSSDPEDWESIAQSQELYSKLDFANANINEHTPIQSLSGGWQKKAALARELMRQPDLLLLDEPTNHLDVESILWLEEFLAKAPFATLTITHDRLFLNRIANKIWEIDKRNSSGILVVQGDYAAYCEVKDQQVAAQERRETVLKNTLRRETEWLRKQPKARTTKSQSRIDSTHELSSEVAEIEKINKVQKVGIAFRSIDDTPKKLIEAKNISKSYNQNKALFSNFDLTLQRGTRIGLIGANGAGKSTLIRVLLGLEAPDTGTVTLSEKLQISYFEQSRTSLDPKETVFKSICPQGEFVKFRGNFVHARGYLDRFLFSPIQTENKVEKLSGGEKARLLIAKLMLQEANLLVLDEPTNDLDLATLNVLEEQLQEFDGAVILVSHDRYFLDQVSDIILAVDNGEIETFHGVAQWESWWTAQREVLQRESRQVQPSNTPSEKPKLQKKLSYNEARELEQMEPKIKKTEAELEKLILESQSEDVIANSNKLLEVTQKMSLLQEEINRLYSRWSQLEGS